jgi:hypothetical protein
VPTTTGCLSPAKPECDERGKCDYGGYGDSGQYNISSGRSEIVVYRRRSFCRFTGERYRRCGDWSEAYVVDDRISEKIELFFRFHESRSQIAFRAGSFKTGVGLAATPEGLSVARRTARIEAGRHSAAQVYEIAIEDFVEANGVEILFWTSIAAWIDRAAAGEE